jgi:hypothetical protein
MDAPNDGRATATVALQRRGDVQKCPVCGSTVDPDAYHCSKCRNYFCFHCRARLLPGEKQFQCVNQDCRYYGKLICNVCDPQVDEDAPPAVYIEPEDGYWPLLLIVGIIALVLAWIFTRFLPAALIALAICAGGAYLISRAGGSLFGRENKVFQARISSHNACISCQQAVKEASGKA